MPDTNPNSISAWKEEFAKRGLKYPPDKEKQKQFIAKNYIPKSITYNELESYEWPEDVFIEGGILSRGDTLMLGAESKGGKSTLLAGMIRQLITGGDFLGFKVTRPLTVLMCQAELREYRLRERLYPTYKDLPLEVRGRVRFWSTRGLVTFDGESLNEIHKEIDFIRPDILVIDPMLNFHRFNENNSQEMANFFRELDRIKSLYDLALIISQHFRKPSTDPKLKGSLLDAIRGSSSLRGWMSTTIAMESRGPDYRQLAFDTRNSDEDIHRLIKYNKVTKDFDWHDPIAQITTKLPELLGDKELNTTAFVEFIKENFGDLCSNNHRKAFDIKETLLKYQVLKPRKSGKSTLLSLA